MDINDNILGTIGNTPMVRINRLNPNPSVNIFAKLEGFNPTGSIKDRIALKMIEDAEADGRLKPGQTIIEPTSGNTGIGLAIVGIIKGYSVEIVMSDAVSVERRKIIRSYGAAVTLTPGQEGTDGAIRLARRKVAENPEKYFMPDQFKNAANYLTHYQSTALEIWQQTGGKIDYLVCALGTSGTIMGLSKFLKVMNPHIKVVCAHPVRGHYIQGLKNMEEAIVPAIYDPSQIDIQEMIESEEAITMARRIIAEEAIFAGILLPRSTRATSWWSSPTAPKNTSAPACSRRSKGKEWSEYLMEPTPAVPFPKVRFPIIGNQRDLFRITNAAMTPGIQPAHVSRKIIRNEAHPCSRTARGGKITMDVLPDTKRTDSQDFHNTSNCCSFLYCQLSMNYRLPSRPEWVPRPSHYRHRL